ncbi:MAG: hypothetical protein K1W26_12045 [Acetatifactor sp.]
MALTNEDLLAISQLLDVKLDARLKPIENRLKRIEVDLLEYNVVPRLNTIESCYTDTYNRYKDYAEKMEAAFADIEIMKKVIAEHSEKLQKLA